MSLILKNSIFFSLFQSNQNLDKIKFKGFSIIRGVYVDKVLKNKVFIASFGFNKDLFFLDSNLKPISNKKKRTFVSYIKIRPFNFINSFFYINLYKKKLIHNYLLKRRVVSTILQKNNLNRSFFLLNNIIKKKIYFQNLKHSTIRQWYNLKNRVSNTFHIKKIVIKITYHRIYSLNTLGIVTSSVKDLYPRLIFTGLVYMLPVIIKKAFLNVFLLFNKLIKYYTRISLLLSFDRNIFFNNYKYFLYFIFLLNKIKKYFKSKNLKIRHSNRFLLKFFKKKTIFKIKRTLQIFFLYNYQRLKTNIVYFDWINILLFNKNVLTFNNFIQNKIIYPGYVKSINTDSRLKIIKFIVLYLNIYNYDSDFITYYKNQIEAYFNIKNSLLGFLFYKIIPYNLLYKTNILKSFIYDMYFIKIKTSKTFNNCLVLYGKRSTLKKTYKLEGAYLNFRNFIFLSKYKTRSILINRQIPWYKRRKKKFRKIPVIALKRIKLIQTKLLLKFNYDIKKHIKKFTKKYKKAYSKKFRIKNKHFFKNNKADKKKFKKGYKKYNKNKLKK